MRRLVLPLCALTTAMGLSPTLAAPPASAPHSVQVPITFSCAPGGPIIHHQPLQRQFYLTVAPGQTLNDSLAVINVSKSKPVSLKIAVDEATTPPLGAGITFIASQNTLGRWLHLNMQHLTVAPHTYTLIPFQMTVPATVAPGEYAGAIAVTDQHPVVAMQGKNKSTVYLSRRCDMLLRVTGQARAGLSIGGVALAKPATLRLTLRNTGTVIDYPVATLLTFTGLNKTYRMQTRINAIVGGHASTLAWSINRRIVPPGTYTVRIEIDYVAQATYGAPPQRLRAAWQGAVAIPAS